jgi:Mn2+/Fe2+ NRAMP family transporter
MAAATQLLLPIPFHPAVIAFGAGIITLEILIPYHSYARLLRFLTLSLVAYIGVVAVVDVDWASVVHSTLVPSLTLDRTSLAALIAVFGTTISPYLFFWQAGEEVEDEVEHDETGPVENRHVRAMRIDVVLGMAAAVLVMFCIMVASAATLGDRGISAISTADQAARALRPVAGAFASALFTVGIVGTGLLAVPVLAGSTAYALSEAMGWREGLSLKLRQAPGFYGVIAASVFVGLALGFVGVNPIRSLYYAAILNGIAAPPLILLMFVLARSDAVDRHRSGPLSSTLVLAAFVVMAILPVLYLTF